MKHAGLILCILLVLGVYGQRTDIPVWKWIQGPHSSLEWNTSASIPSPRADSGYVTSGGVMLLIGGEGLQYPNGTSYAANILCVRIVYTFSVSPLLPSK